MIIMLNHKNFKVYTSLDCKVIALLKLTIIVNIKVLWLYLVIRCNIIFFGLK